MSAAGNQSPSRSALQAPFVEKSALAQSLQLISPHGIFTTDADLRITSWNGWLVTHSGKPAATVIGRRLNEVTDDARVHRLLARYARVLNGEISVLSTALHKYLLPFPTTVPESGQPYMLQTARIAPLREGDRVVGTVTIIEDVTHREHQSSVLLKQQEMDRILSFALSALLKAENPATELNAIFAQVIPLLGLDAFVCHLAGGRRLQLQAAAGINNAQREALATLPLTEAEDHEIAQIADFTQLKLAAHAAAIQRLNFFSSINFPIATGRRFFGLVTFASYERALISAANLKALARIAGYVAIALDRASRERAVVEASQAKDNFLAALSHELRTPLNPVVLIASDAARNPAYPDTAREAFRMIEKNAQLEARLIDDLLDLTKVERGKLTLDLQKVDVHAVLIDAINTVRTDAEEGQITLFIDLEAERSLANADAGRLQQVFWNVIKNAVKFTPAGGEIRISTAVDDAAAELVIHVSDTGIGMHPDEISRIFNAFTQGDHLVDGQAHRFGGLGLGLAISQKILDLHGGRIAASSAGKGQGSTITMQLPLTRGAAAVGAAPAANGPASGTESRGARPATARRILLLEDHDPTRRAMQVILTRKGYDVTGVETCAAALAAAAQQSFDLVLSDIGLPDGDGVEIMRTLRDKYGLRGIALTGYGMEHDVQRSAAAGFLAHLTKPINATLLDRTIGDILSNAS